MLSKIQQTSTKNLNSKCKCNTNIAILVVIVVVVGLMEIKSYSIMVVTSKSWSWEENWIESNIEYETLVIIYETESRKYWHFAWQKIQIKIHLSRFNWKLPSRAGGEGKKRSSSHLIKNEIFPWVWRTITAAGRAAGAAIRRRTRIRDSRGTNAITHRILIGCCTGLSQSVYSLTIVANISFKWNVYVFRT